MNENNIKKIMRVQNGEGHFLYILGKQTKFKVVKIFLAMMHNHYYKLMVVTSVKYIMRSH